MNSKGNQAACRAIFYSFFAQATSPPSDALVRGLSDGSLKETVDSALAGLPPTHRGMAKLDLASGLASDGAADAISYQMILWYTELFGGQNRCPHYEADYVGGDSFRAVHIISDISGFYSTFGVRIASGASERPDYIGVELDFMKLLTAKQSLAAANDQHQRTHESRLAQQKFFGEHLSRWAKQFAENLIAATDSQFYQATGKLLHQFIECEISYLGVSNLVTKPRAMSHSEEVRV